MPIDKPLTPQRLKTALLFASTMWLSSRLIIWVAMLLIAPELPVPSSGEAPGIGWAAFSQWDSEHYKKIVTKGYQFKDNGKGYNVAFFPLYPLLVKGAMSLGLSFEIAGTIVNNLAFWGALVILYLWAEERHGRRVARWSTAALAWCPFSLFGSVIYTEGLFLLGSTAALRSFDRKQYAWAALFGAFTTAIRPPAVALIPTFLTVAWREKRSPAAYLTALLTGTGIASYMVYCWLRFQQPLAFLLAQRGWRPIEEFHWKPWFSLLTTVLLGAANEDRGQIVDLGYPLALVAITILAALLWRLRDRLGFPNTGYGFCVLTLLLWLVGGAPLVTVAMVLGGGYLIWKFRTQLSPTAFWYGVFSWVIILGLGRTISVDRFAFACVPVAIAFGLLISRYPRWAYAVMIFFSILLASYSIRFAQGLWAG
jgi:Gpi18-like mannosyltransferase